MKVTGYMRVSSTKQVDGDGFHRQHEAIEQFVRTFFPGDTMLEYAREDVSGTTHLDERPMFATMLLSWDDGTAEKPDAVVVENLDRFARDLMVQECAIADLKRRGIKVYACNYGFNDVTDDTNDPSRVLIRQLLGAVAQYNKNVTCIRMRLARKRKKELTGRCEGRRPFGDGHDPHEQAILFKILSFYDAGITSSRRIAKMLEVEGIRASNGTPVNDRHIRRMIDRYRYAAKARAKRK